MSITLFGISNCDRVIKAKKWLNEKKVEFDFHDFRKQGLKPNILQEWLKHIDLETLINKRSTTWNKLSEQDKLKLNQSFSTKQHDLSMVLNNLTLIKRPILVNNFVNNKQVSELILTVGFSEDKYSTLVLK